MKKYQLLKYRFNHILLLCFLLSIINIPLNAQNYYSGTIVNEKNQPLEFVSIVITDLDHYVVLNTETDSSGLYKIQLPEKPLDQYEFNVSCFSYKSQKINLSKAVLSSQMVLKQLSHDLDEVEIIGKRPRLVREKNYLSVVSVYSHPLAQGKSAKEFLRFTPLVNVGSDNKLSFIGGEAVTIYINDKPSTTDINSIPAQDIEKIELIRNPGSKYPSDIRGGIINIILKKKVDKGTLYHFNITDEQSFYNSQSFTFAANHKRNNTIITAFIRGSAYNQYFESEDLYKYFSNNKQVSSASYDEQHQKGLSASLRLDQKLALKHSLLYNIESSLSQSEGDWNNKEEYAVINSNIIDSTFITKANITNPDLNFTVKNNLSYIFDIDEDKSLNADISYIKANRSSKTEYSYIGYQTIKNNNKIETLPLIDIDVFGAKVDYLQTINSEIDIEGGISYYRSSINNDYSYKTLVQDQYIDDPLQSNIFDFEDQNFSIYISGDIIFSDQLEATIGLRNENYCYDGFQHNGARSINSKVLSDLFPSLYMAYMPSDNHEISIDLSKSIHRPGYYELNPFKSMIAKNSYKVGNPYLYSSILYDYELSYAYKNQMLIFNYSHSKDPFSEFILPTSGDKTKTTTLNYNSAESIDIYLSLNTKLFKNYLDITFEPCISFSNYKGNIEGMKIDEEDVDYSFDVKSNLFLNKQRDFYISSRFNFNSTFRTVAYQVKELTELNLSLSKSFKNNMSLSLDLYNITYSPIKLSQNTSSYFFESSRNLHSRSISLSFTYRFGDSKARSARKKTNSEIEKRL